ncbi:MAG: gliding motility-associated C-terminal domain-containing protein [Chitinophagaceae bacterium]|nr:gliding motility-associated C-terminal domain-containing protein [Chitinophagaceae bacterium]
MKRLCLVSILLISLSFSGRASHITGGEMYYTFVGVNNGIYQYNVTLKLFQRCGSGRQFNNPAIVSIFDKTNNSRIGDISVPINNITNISITNPDPCITNPPTVCYDVAYYTFSVSLPASAAGYVLASQVNYRINGINNLASGYNNIGATYTAEIPGTNTAVNGPDNNSAVFTGSDLVVVCANNNFNYSFAAQDADGDELRYSFCEAYESTAGGGGGAQPTYPPPFPGVPYEPPFSDMAPLGPVVQINSTTGLITGIAPPVGIYVVTVCVEEIRNGVVIARQRKDIQINIADCDIASASLLPEYMLCRNTQTITIANQSNSPLIVSTDWEFFDNTNTLIYSTSGLSATYTFPAIGLYTVKLIINRGQPCRDSTTALIRVFPGFVPDFSSTGICLSRPTLFTDNTTSVYGTPNSWSWDFGEPTTTIDISSLQNPSYTYPFLGTKNVRLIATDTRGCRDTISKNITIIDKPPIGLAFRDTLICVNDNLVLQASGTGNFSWTPPVNIINANTATPTVSPLTTTTYYVELDDNGCRNRDSVKVNVVSFVTLQAMADTIICRTDTIQLRVNSNGLQYAWTPASQFINATVKNPFAFTNNAMTNYQVTATIGGCSATDNIIVTTVPYPVVNAGTDFSICYNAMAQLNGMTDGSSWQWAPASLVSNPNLLNPVSYPPRTTNYILTAFDTRGCPKPTSDTIRVTVLPKMRVSAGRDTSVIVNQPLQLTATGGINYDWIPATYLSAADISNPVAIFPNPATGIQYKVIVYSTQGCKDSAYINIKVFKTKPTIFVPTAFTPNNDGKNDLLRPIAVGISNIEYFNIYNRWGQLLFSTTINGQGWDGRINGVLQSTGTFVWTVKATDYTGEAYFQKGVVTLIR